MPITNNRHTGGVASTSGNAAGGGITPPLRERRTDLVPLCHWFLRIEVQKALNRPPSDLP